MSIFKPGDIVKLSEIALAVNPTYTKKYIVDKVCENKVWLVGDYNDDDYWTACSLEHCKDSLGIKYDSNKIRYSLLPWIAVKEVVKVLEFGAKKYAVDNWKHIEPQRYKDAAMRHLVAILEGEWLDEESQLPHAAHCVCCLLFLIWFKLNE